ncbi:UNVERIFIED_CONTAM: hypothetical protein NCL1_56364 [Trichonephila clavipes]
MVWGVISYHEHVICYELRVISIGIGTSVTCYSPKSFPFLKASLKLYFSRTRHVRMWQRLFKTSVQPNTCNFFLDLLICRICHLLSKWGIWLFGVSLPSKDELWLRIQTIWSFLPQADIQNLFDSMARFIAALIAVLGGYTKH